MTYLGDFIVGATVRGTFNSRQASGVPATLSGSPALVVYKDGSNVESSAGVSSIAVDFDGRVGLHQYSVNTGSDATFYSSASDFRVALSSGQVNGIDVSGVVVGTFSLQNRYSSGGGGGTGDASQATLLAVKAKTDLITANTVYTTVDRVCGSTITTYFSESTSINVPLQEDTTSKTLRFIVENSDALDVLVIENASITRNASQFTVTITTAVTAMLGQYKWSLRDITGGINRVVQLGVLQVVGAANKDA